MKSRIDTRNYPKSAREVFSAITNALGELNIGITAKDENTGVIKAFSGFSITSTGSDISITVKKTASGCELTIEAKPKMKTLLTDWGRSSKEIKSIFSATEAKLGIAPQAEESCGSVCPSCKKPVSPDDDFCQSCGAKL